MKAGHVRHPQWSWPYGCQSLNGSPGPYGDSNRAERPGPYAASGGMGGVNGSWSPYGGHKRSGSCEGHRETGPYAKASRIKDPIPPGRPPPPVGHQGWSALLNQLGPGQACGWSRAGRRPARRSPAAVRALSRHPGPAGCGPVGTDFRSDGGGQGRPCPVTYRPPPDEWVGSYRDQHWQAWSRQWSPGGA